MSFSSVDSRNNFDGDLICYVPNQIEPQATPMHFVSGQGYAFPVFTLLALASREHDSQTADNDILKRSLVYSKFLCNKVIGYDPSMPRLQLKDVLSSYIKTSSREIIDRVLNGRLRVSLLLDSPGGYVISEAQLALILKMLKDHGATIDAYVDGEAQSGAATLFSLAKRRYVLKDSKILWHAAQDGFIYQFMDFIQGNEDTKREQLEDIRAIEQYLIESSLADCRSMVWEKIQDAREENPSYPEYIFSGWELAQCGIADKSFDSIKDLERQFIKNTGIQPDNHDTVNYFFRLRLLRKLERFLGIYYKPEEIV